MSIRKETRTKKNIEDQRFDLRADVAWNLYTDQRSDTFNNAYRSAIKAGYTHETSKKIGSEKWWQRKVELLKEMLPKAEEVLIEDLNLETKESVVINDNVEYKVNSKLRQIRSETAKFVASTIGRAKYHTKTEIESNNIISLVEGNSLLDNLFKKGK